jgi:amino acid transporter
MQVLVSICAVVAMTSVLLVFQMGQPRIWMSMSRDGLLPSVFQKIHTKFQTPSFATIVTGLVVGVPILFTDKDFVLDFTSIATLFAFVLVCGGVLLIPRKEKVAGRFTIPYVNGKLIFPLIIIGAAVILSVFTKNYFSDKVDYSFEHKVEALSGQLPKHFTDTALVAGTIEQYLVSGNDPDSAFIKLTKTVRAATGPADKYMAASGFIADNDPVQSKTAKISTVIFWLLMAALAVFSFLKNYSLIPLLGVATCLYLLTGMSLSNWLWFGGWLLLGLVIYLLYGYKKSKLAK